MRALWVYGGNRGDPPPFLQEQARSMEARGWEVEWFLIRGQGARGYLSNLPELRRRLAQGKWDVVHAHYGLSGALAVLQRGTPVVTTFHGSDIQRADHRRISRFARWGSAQRIFVAEQLRSQCGSSARDHVLGCGVDLDLFQPMDQLECRQALGLDPAERLVLFSGSFARAEKNAELAQAAVALVGNSTRLLELRGYGRRELAQLMSAANLLLMTSRWEGSPQVIKEALACGLPVVSLRVGDVADRLAEADNCTLVERAESKAVAQAVAAILAEPRRSIWSERSNWSLTVIAAELEKIYLMASRGVRNGR